jgi:hypothetical protein
MCLLFDAFAAESLTSHGARLSGDQIFAIAAHRIIEQIVVLARPTFRPVMFESSFFQSLSKRV